VVSLAQQLPPRSSGPGNEPELLLQGTTLSSCSAVRKKECPLSSSKEDAVLMSGCCNNTVDSPPAGRTLWKKDF